ncbi:unnamed protein product [Ceratitis capitata]|uniref:(Mediterranean fruit fly) hypothetical protein n=1 Tax=Ceratitis capitata TaxID=7213 RepID=A0A811V2P1_CERCA|nr:unnamed protein product [Ceratitis capitata]
MEKGTTNCCYSPRCFFVPCCCSFPVVSCIMRMLYKNSRKNAIIKKHQNVVSTTTTTTTNDISKNVQEMIALHSHFQALTNQQGITQVTVVDTYAANGLPSTVICRQ